MEEWYVFGVDTKAVTKIKEENKQIPGVKLMLLSVDSAPSGDDRFLGQQVREQFLSDERRARLGVDPMPGDRIILYFNRWGDIAKIDIVGKHTVPYAG